MSVWGKILGGAAGLVLGGPFGALVGAVAGHAVDRFNAAQTDDPADATANIGFTIAVIVLGAKMAKADGVVTRSEVRAFREVFHVPPEEEKNVARLFDQAKQDAHGYEPYARQVGRLHGGQARRPDPADGLPVPYRRSRWRHRRGRADLSARRRGPVRHDRPGVRAAARVHIGPDQRDPHVVLGVPADVDDATLKQRYRELIRRHHPDTLIAQGLPEEFVDVATKQMAAINAAYDEISRKRGLT